jgi:hypothetical protein
MCACVFNEHPMYKLVPNTGTSSFAQHDREQILSEQTQMRCCIQYATCIGPRGVMKTSSDGSGIQVALS